MQRNKKEAQAFFQKPEQVHWEARRTQRSARLWKKTDPPPVVADPGSPAPQHPARRSKGSTGSPGPQLACIWPGLGCTVLGAVLGSRLRHLETLHNFISRDPNLSPDPPTCSPSCPSQGLPEGSSPGTRSPAGIQIQQGSVLPPTAGCKPAAPPSL